MTTILTGTAEQTLVAAELAAVDAQLGRVDTKASVLLGVAGAATTVAISALPTVAGAALATAVGAVLAFAAATTALIVAVRPTLKASTRYGFVAYSQRGALPQALAAAVDPDQCIERLIGMFKLVLGKYRRIRVAVDLLVAGLCLSVLTGIIAA